ncbi:MAG: exodeoxyribonuclease large subunit [Clostridiales bacterium]|jgi:exodeoxyribonuclease VII large subunit|nr:exodeoxyribonuclease large subunit [Clostridiales bacterium]
MAEIISVTALNRYVRSLLESDAVISGLALRGEIQNFVHHRSGHFYFSLKDENCSVKAVMFRGNASKLSFEPQNGMRVIVRGKVTLYERDGAFQIYVDTLFPDGQGAAQLAFEQLKAKLEAEGLFSPERKKPLPLYPQRIGLVTSKSGAALHDILSVAQRRWPAAEFLLSHAGVQGKEAEAELVEALQLLQQSNLVDVIIIARGGGSREDLWVFNGEKLARAVCKSSVPVVSAVGHEVDYTILDFVADLRAATPTAAAELVLPDQYAVKAALLNAAQKTKSLVLQRLRMCYNEYNLVLYNITRTGLPRRLDAATASLQQQKGACAVHIQHKLQAKERQLAQIAALTDSLSPYHTMARGYCVALKQGHTVKQPKDLVAGDKLNLVFRTFSANCMVTQVTGGSAIDEKEAKF